MTPRKHRQAAAGTPRRVRLLVAAILALFLLLAVFGFWWAKQTALATLVDLSGAPQRDEATAVGQWESASEGDDFDKGDGARTAADATAVFRLINGAQLRLQPASQVRFNSPARGRLKVDVEMGAADLVTGAGAVSIDSEFGELVLDANSTVTLSRNGSQLDVAVELGSIQLNQRRLKRGDTLQLELGGIVVDVQLPAAQPPPSPSATQAPEPPAPELELGDGVASAELVNNAGESFIVHDPNPPTAIGFRVAELCKGPATLRAGGLKTQANDQANLRLDRGYHKYEIRCLSEPNKVAARGSVRILRDAGTKKLPMFRPKASVTADGRRYTVLYQHRLPQITISWPTAPEASSYTLNLDGQSIQTSKPSYTTSSLRRGKHKASFRASTTPARQSRTSQIDVVYDTQGPTARVATPSTFPRGSEVPLQGQALPGWKVSVDGTPLALDSSNRFSEKLRGDAAIPIAFSRPGKATHYYMRRAR